MRKTKDEAEVSKKLILDAANKVFLNKGYSATNLSDIAKEIGMTRGVIYWHFRNKLELFINLLEKMVDESMDHAQKILQSDGPLPDKLKKLLQKREGAGTQFIELLKSFHPGLKDVNNREREKAIKTIRNKMQTGFTIILKTLSDAQRAGQVGKNIDLQAFSAAFLLAASMLSATSSPDRTDAEMPFIAILRSKHNEIVNMLWNGLGSAFIEDSVK